MRRRIDAGSFGYPKAYKSFAGTPSVEPTKIRVRSKNSYYEEYKEFKIINTAPEEKYRVQLRESNNRLKALEDLDKKREAQLKKDFEELEMRRKQQREEIRKRINRKKVILTETDQLKTRVSESFSNSAKEIIKNYYKGHLNQQQIMVILLIYNRTKDWKN